MNPADMMEKYTDAKSKDRPHRTVGKAEFVRLMVAAGHAEAEASHQAKIAYVLGGEVLVGDEWLSIRGG